MDGAFPRFLSLLLLPFPSHKKLNCQSASHHSQNQLFSFGKFSPWLISTITVGRLDRRHPFHHVPPGHSSHYSSPVPSRYLIPDLWLTDMRLPQEIRQIEKGQDLCECSDVLSQHFLCWTRETDMMFLKHTKALAVICDESDIRYMKALIIGPPGTPYEFGFFEVSRKELSQAAAFK